MRGFHVIRLRGFTLIELLVTLTILALLASAAAPMMQLTAKRSKEQELRRALWEIRDAIDAYKQAVDDGLILSSPDKSGYPPDLAVLVNGVANAKDPKQRKLYFLRQIPRDPFATDAAVANEGTWRKRSYASSFGDDESGFAEIKDEDVYDVRSKSRAVGLNGRPYSEW
jgi:general secretion pathway protein G